MSREPTAWWNNMPDERFNLLMHNCNLKLTPEELNFGWHFCAEFDGLVVNAHDPKMRECGCRCMDSYPGFKYGEQPC